MSSTNAPTPGSAKALLAAGARCENLLGHPVYGMETLETVQLEGLEKDCMGLRVPDVREHPS